MSDWSSDVCSSDLSSFRNHLEKYEYLPGVLAQDRDVRALLRHPDDPQLIQNVNARLQRLNAAARTSVLYVMSLDGTTRAASNWTEPTSFVGQNYSFRPYFQNADRQSTRLNSSN